MKRQMESASHNITCFKLIFISSQTKTTRNYDLEIKGNPRINKQRMVKSNVGKKKKNAHVCIGVL